MDDLSPVAGATCPLPVQPFLPYSGMHRASDSSICVARREHGTMASRSAFATVMLSVTCTVCTLAKAAPPATKPAATKPAATVDETTLARESRNTHKKLEFAVKDLTPKQRQKALPITAEYGPLYEAMEAKDRAEHEAIISNARNTGTSIDLKADNVRMAVRDRAKNRLEAKYFDRIGAEALTPAQRIKWDAYRLQFASTFQLSFTGMDQEQLKKLEPLAVQVATQLKPASGEDSYKLLQRRVKELDDRATKTLMNEEQRKKYETMRASSDELGRQMDELEAR